MTHQTPRAEGRVRTWLAASCGVLGIALGGAAFLAESRGSAWAPYLGLSAAAGLVLAHVLLFGGASVALLACFRRWRRAGGAGSSIRWAAERWNSTTR